MSLKDKYIDTNRIMNYLRKYNVINTDDKNVSTFLNVKKKYIRVTCYKVGIKAQHISHTNTSSNNNDKENYFIPKSYNLFTSSLQEFT